MKDLEESEETAVSHSLFIILYLNGKTVNIFYLLGVAGTFTKLA